MIELPRHKTDTERAERLADHSDDELLPHVPELLTWLQDANWPVARHIAPLLARFDHRIVPHIRAVFAGDDEVWKYWLLSLLVPELDRSVREQLMDDVIRMINTPTEGERREEVDLAARDIVIQHSGGD